MSMSMFGGLFEDDDPSFSNVQQTGDTRAGGIPRPTLPRSGVKLCGLSNLGATCYMNALLQTMIYTPELREALLSLTKEELGLSGDHVSLIRSIPVQLQILFSRILLLNQNSVGVEGLINSFGWTNNEELQQHDVQELNRILFDALESSLIGTSRQTVVHNLFHGTTVQQIICSGCGQVSEREEDFLDLSLPLSARPGLEYTLKEMFCDTERLDGKNQYRCDSCQGLVDAERCCRLKTLPPILTFALLRFLYDYQKGERYKDTNRFQFPLSLDMSSYMDNSKETESLMYDLFSVVIHSGSTHSGHYIAYIRDIDGLGTWTHPSEEGVTLNNQTTDPLEFNSPRELLEALLRQLGGSSSVNTICKQLQDQTGVTWNKRFKNGYGPIKKFLKTHSDVFTLDNNDNDVTLKTTPLSEKMSSVIDDKKNIQTSDNIATHPDSNMADNDSKLPHNKKDAKSDPPPIGQRWYEFNDSSVNSILTESINKMFQGKQSAYMLFYRQRNLQRPAEAINTPSFGVPERLVQEVMMSNKALETERKQYDIAVNTISLSIHTASSYNQVGGALHNIMDGLTHLIKIDRRCSLAKLQSTVMKKMEETGLITDTMTVIHTAKHLPAGLHLYDCITNDKDHEQSILEAGITTDIDLFVWDGVQVGGESLLVGKDHEPVCLHLSYSGQNEMVEEVSLGFAKSSTLFIIRDYFSQLLTCQPIDVNIYQVKRSTRSGNASSVLLQSSKDSLSVFDLQLENGDRLAAEIKAAGSRKGSHSVGQSVAKMQNTIMTFIVENRCLCIEEYPVYPVEVTKTKKLSEVKLHILSQLNLLDLEGGGRLRIDDDLQGVGPPLCEEHSLVEAGLTQGCRVILEKGTPPLSNEIYLSCSSEYSQIDGCEVVVSKATTVKKCCELILPKLGLEGTEWHLRKTNWCGEVGGLLDDEEATLEKLRIKSGERLIIEKGKLPPKGFVRISVYQHDQYSQVNTSDLHDMPGNSERGNKEDDVMETTKEGTILLLHEQDHTQYYPPTVGTITRIGDIEINRNSTLEQLKETIMTLPLLSDTVLPTIKYLRIREIVNDHPGKVFRQLSARLKQLRLYSGGVICCQLLSYEEDLSLSEIVFYLQQRIPYTRTYGPPFEVTYDTACSATPIGLRNFIANIIGIPPEGTAIAKHKFEKFQWIRIEGKLPRKTDSKNTGGKSKRKSNSLKEGDKGCTNIKTTPVSLHDGDIVGVKDLQNDPDNSDDDYMTLSDDKGLAILLAIQEEKRRSRKAKATGYNDDTVSKRQRRPEVGIKIHVPDFSNHL